MKSNNIGYSGYLTLFFIAMLVTVISIVVEAIYPMIGNERIGENPLKTLIYRGAHFYVSLYCAFYLLFFRPVGINSYIYLIFNLLMNFQWCIAQCCILSYYELLNYQCNYRAFSTRFHPYIFSLLRNWSDVVMDLIGVLILWNILVIMYFNGKIPWVTKILYLGIFGYSIYVCCSGKNPLVDILRRSGGADGFDGGDKVLAMKREIQRVDGLFMYPSEPDSFFMKYIAVGN